MLDGEIYAVGKETACRLLATSGGAHHRLATPELPPGADIRDRTSALSDFRRLYPQLRTLKMALPMVRT